MIIFLLVNLISSMITSRDLRIRANTFGALSSIRPYPLWNTSEVKHDPGIEPIYDYSWQSISRLAKQTASHSYKAAYKGIKSLFHKEKETPNLRKMLVEKEGDNPAWDGWTGEATLTDEQRSYIDGEIMVKMGNVSGYDLYFPNGSYKWTQDIMGEYLCQRTYSDKPWKDAHDEFDIVGFVLAVLLGLLFSVAITATFPTLILIKTQNANLAEQQEENRKNLGLIAEAVNAKQVDDIGEDEKKKKKEKLKRMDKISVIWLSIGSVVCVALAIFVADMVLAAYGARHILKIAYIGECYTFNVDNVRYKEPDDTDKYNAMKLIAKTRAKNIIRQNRNMLRKNKVAKYANNSAALLSTDDFMTHDALRNIKRSLLSASTKNIRDSIGLKYANGSLITLSDFDDYVESMAVASMMKPLADNEYEQEEHKYLSTASVSVKTNEHVIITYGCDSSLYSPSDGIEWKVTPDAALMEKEVIMRINHKGENFIKTGCPGGKGKQKIDRPEWATHEFGYNCIKKGCGCCKPCASCNQWVCNNIFFNVSNESWVDCYLQTVPATLKRNEIDVSKKYHWQNLRLVDARQYWGNGWLMKDSQVIVKTSTFSDGRGTSIYVGSDSDEDWLKTFVSGNNPLSYSVNFVNSPEKLKYEPVCTQQITINLDDATKDLVEFQNWCNNVKAYINNDTGIVEFTTESNSACMIEVAMSSNADNSKSTLRLSRLYPARAFGIIMWNCKTDGGDNSRGTECSYNNPLEPFIGEKYTGTYEMETVNKYISDSKSPGDAGINIKTGLKLGGGLSTLKTVATFFGYIAGGLAFIGIVFGIYYAAKKCGCCKCKNKKDYSESNRSGHHRVYSRRSHRRHSDDEYSA